MIIIINVFASLDSGGAENRTMDVYRNIDKTKYQFHFISFSLAPNQYFEQEIEHLGGKVIKLASPRSVSFFEHISMLVDVFKQYNLNHTVVHSHTLYHSGLVLFAAYKAGIKIRIAHARASQSISKGIKNEAFILVGKLLIHRYATHRFAVSNVAGQFLFGRDHYQIVPNAIDIDKYNNFTITEREKYRKEFDIKENDIILGHIGRLEPEKNHEFILSIFSQYNRGNSDSKLILIGDGRLKKNLKQRIKELGIEKNVIMCGIRRDANRLINLFDLIIFPSIFEGLPGVILEAQAAGIPSILSSNITREIDLGIGLVKFVDVTNKDRWIYLVEVWRPNIPPLDVRKSAFEYKKLSVSSEISQLIKVYDLLNS